MTSQAIEPISNAHERVEREQARTQAEKRAFQRFHSLVADIECKHSQDGAWRQHQQSIHTLSDTEPGGTTVGRIEDAFQETLLDTSHYHNEYNDASIYETIAAELGPAISHILKQNSYITSDLQTTILGTAEQASRDRKAFLIWLDQEATSLTEADNQLCEITTTVSKLADPPFEARSAEDLRAIRDQLYALEHDCDMLANQRQAFLNERPPLDNLHLNGKGFNEYLYSSQDFTYPVLLEITACVERIQRVHGKICKHLVTE
ncbi:DUF7260 family protein [Halococcus salsus]|uniref:DUF7260 family protein n=1 Tax=Halococcus salsus TaxID=2162894 RepID=UPI00135B3C37|nr:hypothetical protein [Halococcus salsus]